MSVSEPPLFAWWEWPAEAAVRDDAPKFISFHDKQTFERALARGEADFHGEGDGLPLFVTIGLDFGTSSTKIITRFVAESETPAIAIPAPPHCRVQADPYLWRTVLWAQKDGKFVPWPESDAVVLHTLKQGIVGNRPTAVVAPGYGPEPGITKLDAATAYLAFIIRYVRGWLLLNLPDRFRGRRIAWFANLGLPAADQDDPHCAAIYRTAACAAMVAAAMPGSIDCLKTRACLSDQAVRKSAASAMAAEEIGVAVVPEVAAAVSGFTKSTATADGLYLMVDVGALTLDACVFRFRRGPTDIYPLLRAEVRPLGVEAFHWFLKSGRTRDGFVGQCDRLLKQVVWDTKREGDPAATVWNVGNSLPMFFVGGGARNELHQEVVAALGPWLQRNTPNSGVRAIDLPHPSNLTMPEAGGDFGRLAVAWGLSYPPRDIGQIMLPSTITALPPTTRRDYSSTFISKDQM